MYKLTEELQLKSKGIYNGLITSMNESQSQMATKIWINEFSDKPLYAVRGFIDRIYELFTPDIPRASLQRNLLASLMMLSDLKDNQEIGSISIDLKRVVDKAINNEDKNKHKGFMLFINAIFEIMKQNNQADQLTIKVALIDNLHKMGIKGQLASNIKQWLTNGREDISLEGIGAKQMASIFHKIYTLSCNITGPVETDHMITEVVTEFEEAEPVDSFIIKEIF